MEAAIRDFIDAILAFIGTTSLTDSEFATITETSQTYTVALYTEILAVLDSRESVSNTRERLTYYFLARDVAVTEPAAAQSEIYIGDELCN